MVQIEEKGEKNGYKIETVTAGSSSISYDVAADIYNYVWKTDKTWYNSCRQLMVKLKDDTYHNASFKFK